MPLRLTIFSNLFNDDPNQDVLIREDLTVQRLLMEIKREYNLPEGEYRLHRRDSHALLDGARTLQQQGIRDDDVVAFSVLQELDPLTDAFLRSQDDHVFPLRSASNLIGRRDASTHSSNELPAVDFTAVDPNKTISRRHATISRKGSDYFIQRLNPVNPLYLNGVEVATGDLVPLHHADWLQFGREIRIQFCLKDPPKSS